MNEPFEQAYELARSGGRPVLATVIQARGSTPRRPGAVMVVPAEGDVIGTVGGGSGEALVIREAGTARERGCPALCRVEMFADENAAEGMVCGGAMTVLLEPLGEDQIPWLRAAADVTSHRAPIGLVRAGGAGGAPPRVIAAIAEDGAVWNDDDAPLPLPALPDEPFAALTGGEREITVQRIDPYEQLIVVGGGHIGAALTLAASRLGFRVTVVDDRAEFVTPERHPHAAELLHGEYDSVIADIPTDSRTYYALVTRGYRADVGVLRALAGRPAAYIGMIGSRRRIATVFRVLTSEGIDRKELDRVSGPIGIDIGAETPEEIAVSIAGELIRTRRDARSGERRSDDRE